MVEQPARQEIDELVRRLKSSRYALSDIREAAEILVHSHERQLAYQLALDFSVSDHSQVRSLGLGMMESLAPSLESARGFLAGARDAARLLRQETEAEQKPVPDYSAIGEVIKVWLAESRKNRPRRPR